MERQMIFRVLGIQETKDEHRIRDAYRALLKNTNPEDDPEGFKRLREAYEEALRFARQPEDDEGEEKEKTQIDLWVEQVDRIYRDIRARQDTQKWQQALSDPVCDDLDTSLEAREAFLLYLMDHIYLPGLSGSWWIDSFRSWRTGTTSFRSFPRIFWITPHTISSTIPLLTTACFR